MSWEAEVGCKDLQTMLYIYLTTLTAAAVAWVIWRIIYNLLLSPLRSIPGPFLARITAQWLIMIDAAGNRTTTIHGLHQKYGPSVRIGPNEISYSNAEMVKELYSQQTSFTKAPLYEAFVVRPAGIFGMRDKAAHSQRRRLLSHAFSQSNLLDTEPIIKQMISKLVGQLQAGEGKPADVLLLFRLTAFDIVGELFLGKSPDGLDLLRSPPLLEDIDRFFVLGGVQAVYPWLVYLAQFLPIPSLRRYFAAEDNVVQFGRDAFNDYICKYGRDSGRRDLLTKIVTNKTAEEAPMSDREIYVEIAGLVFAGTDTTSMTLTYLFWELARHQGWQTRLRTELSTANIEWVDDLPSFRDIAELPLLDAVVNEALRLHPAAPSSLPRETPAGGRTLNGVFIPEKTVVSMQCYTTQRDPRVFPDPDSFLPERWLEPDDMSPEAKALFMPFSSGPRVCLGKNLAMMELKLITSVLVRWFAIQVAPGTTEDGMNLTDHFLAMPKAGKCELILTRV